MLVLRMTLGVQVPKQKVPRTITNTHIECSLYLGAMFIVGGLGVLSIRGQGSRWHTCAMPQGYSTPY